MATALIPAWTETYRKIEQMFKGDSEVYIVYDNENYAVSVYVDNNLKADALTRLLKPVYNFGNIQLCVNVIPSNNVMHNKQVKYELESPADLYRVAFENNPALKCIKTIAGVFSNDMHYIVFAKRVVQYYNDDLGDINGLKSTLYETIAKDIFETLPGVFFCTNNV